MSSTATLHGRVRLDLGDVAEVMWADAAIDRVIQRAVREYSHFSPLEVKTTLTTAANSRNVDVVTLTPRMRIVAAEYPTAQYPPAFVPFTLWGDTLTLDLVAAPSGTPNVFVYWHKEHTQHATVDASCTYPSTDDAVIETGAAAYAAQEAATARSNKINVGGENVWGRLEDFGRARMSQYMEMLRQLPAVSVVRTSRLYTADDVRLRSQSTDPGPV